MTSQDKMLKAWDVHDQESMYKHGGIRSKFASFEAGWEAALHSVEAEKEPEWISCADRLPTPEDGDPMGWVWVWHLDKYGIGEVRPRSVAEVFTVDYLPFWTHVRRPAPPEHKPE